MELPDLYRITFLAVIGSLVFILIIIELIRRNMLSERYALIWLLASGLFFLFATLKNLWVKLSTFIGIDYPPSALFLVLIIGVVFVLLLFSIVISGLNEKVKRLTQEIGLINLKLNKKDKS
jgi:hypothetical protein